MHTIEIINCFLKIKKNQDLFWYDEIYSKEEIVMIIKGFIKNKC